MKYALAFTLFGAVSVARAATAESSVASVFLANVGVAFLGVGLAYAGLGPRVFLKRPDGRLSPLSYVLFWPYFALNHLMLRAYRLLTKRNAFDEIASGVILGARLYPRDEQTLGAEPIRGVLDLTSEFAEVGFLRNSQEYLCIPLLDATAPSRAQLEQGVAWLLARSGEGAVYVHCAMGHGRSATFVAALLVTRGIAADVAEAEAKIRAIRPRAALHDRQRAAVADFVRDRR